MSIINLTVLLQFKVGIDLITHNCIQVAMKEYCANKLHDHCSSSNMDQVIGYVL